LVLVIRLKEGEGEEKELSSDTFLNEKKDIASGGATTIVLTTLGTMV